MKEMFIGSDCEKYMGLLKLKYPVQHGVFKNENDILPLFNHIYSKLEISSEEIKDHPVLITEPLLNPYSNREKIASALFESLGVPALFFASQPILSLFATSNTSGVILESGEGVTQSCVVYEGYSIPNSFQRYDYGGRDVTQFLQTLFKRSGYSFTTTAEFEIVKKIKEGYCYSMMGAYDETKKTTSENSIPFYLPDGTPIKLGDEKFLAPEILFNPSLLGLEYLSFQEMIVTSLYRVDIDLRKALFNYILIAGGNTLLKQVPDRLHSEIKKLRQGNGKIKLHAPVTRKNSCWLGGNVISILEIFKKMWVAKGEYGEQGKNIVHTKRI